MRSSTFIAFAVGIAMLAPTGVFAEETAAVSGSADAGASTNAGGETGTVKPKGPGGPMQIKIITPRDSASGQATGKVMLRASSTPVRPGVKTEMQGRMMASGTPEKMNDRMDAAKERMGERRDEMKTRIMEKKSEILKRMAKQSILRLRAAADRLGKLADRLEARITKIKEKGGDTVKAAELLATARVQITAAKTAIATAEASIATAVVQADASASSTTNVDAGKPIREALRKAGEALKIAHKALVDAIVALKASVPKETLNADASVVVSASTTNAQ